ncbi:hypothetical protein BSNK01_06430 [Bacillaceae bacterium]
MKRFVTYLLLPLLCLILLAGCNLQERGAGDDKQPAQQEKNRNLETMHKREEKKRQDRSTPDLAGGPEAKVREPHPLTLADLAHKYPTVFILRGPSGTRKVALTFDDGPDAVYTPQILDVLKKHNVKATFFLVGNRSQAHPEIVRRIVAEGHEIGNHSWNHANLPKLSDADFHWQVQKTDDFLYRLTGYRPKLFRAPYGAVNEEQIKWLAAKGYKVIGWNVDSLDWKGLSKEAVSDNVLSNITPGAIILQHSAGGKKENLSGTVQALPEMIKKLRADNVELVTVSNLLGR